MGIKQLVRKCARKATGDYEKIDALFYYLDHLHSISDFPKATGALRQLQLADVKLLQIIDRICKNEGIEYWLDSGTLLGAIRHGGFIPWDDDTDLCMDRENYLKARKILPKVCSSFGIDAKEDESCRGGWIGVGYKHKDTGVWADIFPQDYSSEEITIPGRRKQLETEISAYHLKYQRKMRTVDDMEAQEVFRKRIISSICKKNEAKALIAYCEFWPTPIIYDYNDVFPLKKVLFEGASLLGPNNCDKYLREQYGDYMKFPQNGVLQHGQGRGSLDTWAERSNTNMMHILEELENVYQKLCK